MSITTEFCPNLLKALECLEVPTIAEMNGRLMGVYTSETKFKVSEEIVEIPPKDEVDANMIKRGFLKPRMRPKSISIECKPRTKD